MRFCCASGRITLGPRPFLIGPPMSKAQQGAVVGDFAYHLHMELGLLPGTAGRYVREVMRVHHTHDLPLSVKLTPGLKLMDRRLDLAGRAAPNRRFAMASDTLRLGRWADDDAIADVSLLVFFLAGRPIECLAGDTGPPNRYVVSWHRVKWRTVCGAFCHPNDANLHYALVHVYRKGDTYSGHWVPLFLTGSPWFCGLRALQRLYRRSGQPTKGPIAGRFSNSTSWMRRSHLGQHVRRLATAANLPPFFFTAYSLRRGYITAMSVAGVRKPKRMIFCGHRETGSHHLYVDPDPRDFAGVAARAARTIIMSAGRR